MDVEMNDSVLVGRHNTFSALIVVAYELFFFFQAEDGIRDLTVTGVQTCALPISSWREPSLRACSQAGLVNNLNDALAWGLVPLYLAARGASVGQIGLVAALYPAVWGMGQIATGAWSDRVGRKPLIVAGMLVQAVALGVLALTDGELAWAGVTAAGARGGHAALDPPPV